jgi:hypothetical protein
MNQIPISLFLTMGKQRINWNDILFLSSSVRGDRMETITLPEGWAPVPSPSIPDPFMDRDGQMVRLGELISRNEISALTGEPGIGKKSLVSAWARKMEKKVLWMKEEENGDFNIDPARYDLIVLIGSSMVDMASTLVDGNIGLRDPRDETWPEIMRAIPILGILEGSMDVQGGPLMNLEGLDEASFTKRAIQAGLPEEVTLPYFHASKGSPMALAYVEEMDDTVLKNLGSLDEEAAVMSLMLGLRSRL